MSTDRINPKKILIFLALIAMFTKSALANDGIEPAEKEIIKISETGASPSVIHFNKEDGSVFFLNTSKDSLMTLDIDFKGKRAHCASSNMKFTENGHLRSTLPVGINDFAISCFPEKGIYSFVAYGILKNQKPVTGTVLVE